MQINVIYDQSQSSLPAAFVAAVNYVVNYFDTTFTNPITVNIDLGYGEIAGQSLGSGALGESETYFNSVPYSQAVSALKANQPSATQQAAYSTLPGSSPVSGGTLWGSTAEEKALGLLAGNNPAIDGYVGLSSTYPFSYSAGATPAAGQYYFDGVLAHEFSEVLGRGSLLGDGLGGTNSYSIMDLFRYSAPGSRQLGVGGPAYFSINSGTKNLDSWNTDPNGDLGDWAGSAGADAFLAFSASGQIDWITQPDLALMNVLGYDVVASQAPALTVVGTGDFNNDGTSDILFDNSGTIATWEMNGSQGVTRAIIDSSLPIAWQIVGAGDFNGDHISDILLQNTSGSIAVWLMNGAQIQTGLVIASPPSSWHVVATADFNSDQMTDILLQNTSGTVAVWLMNGTQIQTGAVIASLPSYWRIAGAGDFSGDHISDIALQNSNGDVAIWEMNGTQIQSGVVISSPGSNWHVVGIGDFSGDHISDMVLQNTDGRVDIWEMNGTTIVSSTMVGTMTSDWHIVGIADFNGDHTSDILWQNNNGALEIWEMNGGQVTSAKVSPPAGAPIGGAYPLTDGPSNTTPLVAGTQGKLEQSVALLSQYMASAFTPSGFGDSASPVVDPTAASPGQTPFFIQPTQDHPRQG